ncbi:MAG: CotH kinase family protein [Verrucomicrobiota bacterium]
MLLFLTAGGGRTELRINEIVSSNGGSWKDETGATPDWIELRNTGPAAVALEGYGLSDNPDRPFKWTFPARTLAAGGYLVVAASGEDRRTGAVLHTSFSLGRGGETLLLTAPGGVPADMAPATELRRDMSYGRAPADGVWRYFPKPTPSAANTGASFAEVLHQGPVFSAAGGFSGSTVTLTLTQPDPQAVLRYTLDGSEPGETSPVYAGPLTLTSRTGDANVLSMIQGTATVNQHTDGWKAPLGEVRKARLVRARIFKEGAVPSPTVSNTYFIGPEARRTDGLAVMSLMSARDGLFDYNTGIYMLGKVFDNYVAAHPGEALTGHTPANYTQRGEAWQRECSVEFFEPDGTRAWAAPAWLDIKGQSSRSFRQKSFGIDFRSETPPERAVGYPIFPGLVKTGDGSPLEVFQHLRLRNYGNDWAYATMRDGFCHQLADGLGLDRMAWRPVAVYLDGEYWGILELREQQDPVYFAAHYGVNADEVAVLNGDGSLEEGLAADTQSFLSLRTYAETHDLSKPEFLAWMEARMDLENFLRYQAAEIYFGNADWPHNNTRMWRVRRPDNFADRDTVPKGHDGRWRWMLFDLDLAVAHPWAGGYGENTLSYAIAGTGRPGTNAPWATSLLRALLKNPDVKARFATVAADLMNSHFKAARATAMADTMQAKLEPGIAEHIRRWQSHSSAANWVTQVKAVRTWASQREPNVRQHFTSTLSLGGYAMLTVDRAPAGGGEVQVNSLRINAALPGATAAVYPWSGTYFRQVPVALTAVPAPGMEFEKWVTPSGENAGPVLSLALTGPTTVTAHFRMAPPRWESIIQRSGGGVSVVMAGGGGVNYELQFSTNLTDWRKVEAFTVNASGRWERDLPPPEPGKPAGYYRAVRLAP